MWLFPYKNTYYQTELDKDRFIEKLNVSAKQKEISYQPGQHIIDHQPQSNCFYYRRKRINPGSGSGGVFKFIYKVVNGKIVVRLYMAYSPVVYFLFLLAVILTFGLAYIPINLFFQMEAYNIKDDFESDFVDVIIKKSLKI
jgi:hypothetical protein